MATGAKGGTGGEGPTEATAPAAIARFDVEGVAQVVKALKKIETEACRRAPLHDRDGVACFDFLYTIITENVLRCVQNRALEPDDPRFQDTRFMSALDVAFANRYLAAMGVGPKPPFQPKCWQALLDYRETRDISPLIFAVAGVNAHVNFDLPFALITACTVLDRELESGYNRSDYDLINRIFANHMQQLRQHFENKFELGFDKALVSMIENRLGDVVVVVARDLAWRTARKLWPTHLDEAKMLRAAKARDQLVAATNWGLFQLDRLPALAFRSLHLVPGPTKAVAKRGLSRTGWGTHGRYRIDPPAAADPPRDGSPPDAAA